MTGEVPGGDRDHEETPSIDSSSKEFWWSLFEEVAGEIIENIQPTSQSESIRRSIAHYIQMLVQTHFLGSQVVLVGSLPLKTYLSDGDMDLTVFAPFCDKNDLCDILRAEEARPGRVFQIRNVNYIDAEVPVIKCLVENIPVDICFLQTGGLDTLNFLELIDGFIGREHLFKRSVLLIKAWCFYESRILGSSHSLLSTFGLEIMILHVINYSKTFIGGPLSILYLFLEYFSKFDWDQFGVSVCGIVVLSHLPRIVVTNPPDFGGGRYFTDEQILLFKRENLGTRTFPRKFLNIFDPLVEYNNLGRSVAKGNSRRIRIAMEYGYQKLKAVLEKRGEDSKENLRRFFVNTIKRHDHGARADVLVGSMKRWMVKNMSFEKLYRFEDLGLDDSVKKFYLGEHEKKLNQEEEDGNCSGKKSLSVKDLLLREEELLTRHPARFEESDPLGGYMGRNSDDQDGMHFVNLRDKKDLMFVKSEDLDCMILTKRAEVMKKMLEVKPESSKCNLIKLAGEEWKSHEGNLQYTCLKDSCPDAQKSTLPASLNAPVNAPINALHSVNYSPMQYQYSPQLPFPHQQPLQLFPQQPFPNRRGVPPEHYWGQQFPQQPFLYRRGVPPEHYRGQQFPQQPFPNRRGVPPEHYRGQKFPQQPFPNWRGVPPEHYRGQQFPQQPFPNPRVLPEHYRGQQFPHQPFPNRIISPEHYRGQQFPQRPFPYRIVPPEHYRGQQFPHQPFPNRIVLPVHYRQLQFSQRQSPYCPTIQQAIFQARKIIGWRQPGLTHPTLPHVDTSDKPPPNNNASGGSMPGESLL